MITADIHFTSDHGVRRRSLAWSGAAKRSAPRRLEEWGAGSVPTHPPPLILSFDVIMASEGPVLCGPARFIPTTAASDREDSGGSLGEENLSLRSCKCIQPRSYIFVITAAVLGAKAMIHSRHLERESVSSPPSPPSLPLLSSHPFLLHPLSFSLSPPLLPPIVTAEGF